MRVEFDRLNLFSGPHTSVVAHDGIGRITFRRLVEDGALAGGVNFIDHAILPPGVSIGRHRHSADEEELYLVLSGEGRMWRDGTEFTVVAGDLVRNLPGGAHGLENTGHVPLALFVIALKVEAGTADAAPVTSPGEGGA